MTYQVQYKCRHCEQRMTTETGIIELSKADAIQFVNKVMQNQFFKGNAYLYQAPDQLIHECKDGSVAIADIVGLVDITKSSRRLKG